MKHLEKIIFLVCLLVVAGLSAWVFLGSKSEEPVATDVPLRTGFELGPYAGMPEIPDAEWDEPIPQDDEGKWLYRVFTPPIIYLVDGTFTVIRPEEYDIDEPPPPPPFGVRLAEIIRNKYRLQLDAVYETTLDDVDTAALSFENVYATETERPTITLKKGETSEAHRFRVEDIRKEERIVGGGLEREYVATITDLDTGKVVLLSDLTTLFEEGVVFRFESTVNPGEEARVSNVGDTFTMNDATYTLSEINLDQRSVEVVKEAEYLDVPERETLTPLSRPEPPAVSGESVDTAVEDTSPEPPETDDFFNDDFFGN